MLLAGIAASQDIDVAPDASVEAGALSEVRVWRSAGGKTQFLKNPDKAAPDDRLGAQQPARIWVAGCPVVGIKGITPDKSKRKGREVRRHRQQRARCRGQLRRRRRDPNAARRRAGQSAGAFGTDVARAERKSAGAAQAGSGLDGGLDHHGGKAELRDLPGAGAPSKQGTDLSAARDGDDAQLQNRRPARQTRPRGELCLFASQKRLLPVRSGVV